MKTPNLRTMKVTTSSGKDANSTQVGQGEAKKTKAWNEKNETTQYTTGKPSHGSTGGMNTNS